MIKAMQSSRISRKRTPSPPVSTDSSNLPPDFASFIQPDPPVNMLHAELLYHLSTETLPSLCMGGNNLILLHKEPMKHGLAAPFLMNELLALAAIHLSIIRETQNKIYRHHSTQLQNHALRMFYETDSDPNIGSQVCIYLLIHPGYASNLRHTGISRP
jgi:hypothetical protein